MSSVSNENKTIGFQQLIVKCSPEKLRQFLYQIIDLFCGQKGPQYKDFSDIWNLLEWWEIIETSQTFLKTYHSTENSLEDLLNDISGEHKDIILECLDVRSEDLKEALLQRTNEISHAFLKDYDWKLKMTLASDKVAQINEPRLELDFNIQEGNQDKILSLDMSKDEVKQLIDVLEAATNAAGDNKMNETHVMENISVMCMNSCSGHGECYDGTCVCEVQFAGGTCNDLNFNYYIAFATIFYLIFGVSLIQLILCIKAEYDKMKPSFILSACRVTTQKALYVVICLATALRGIYFSVPKPEAVLWAFSLLSAYYPILLTGASLIVCFWAEVFHLKNLSFDGKSFLSKSLLGFIVFNVITYSLLIAELFLLNFSSKPDEEKNRLISIFQGCYAILMLIVVIFFLIYGVEVYFKVRGEFIKDSSLSSTNFSQLHQSRIGLVSQAMLLLFMAAFISSDSLGSFWKDKVPVLSRNCYDVLFRVIEMGVILWFPCVLWNCKSPEQLWILNPRTLFRKLEGPTFFHSGEDEALASSIKLPSDEAKATEASLCWICYDADAQNSGPMIQPCNCKGDMSAVHHDCLKKWLMRCSQTSGTRCKVCNEKYVLECYTRWLPQGITALNWFAVVALVIVMPSVATGMFLLIHHYSDTGIQSLVAGGGLLIEYVCLKLLAFNVLKGYQRGKIAAVTILSKKTHSDQPLIHETEVVSETAVITENQ